MLSAIQLSKPTQEKYVMGKDKKRFCLVKTQAEKFIHKNGREKTIKKEQ